MANPIITSTLTGAARSAGLADDGVFSAQSELPARRAFVVHLTDSSAIADGQFAGRVEHVSSGQRQRFASLDELTAFISRAVRDSETSQ